MGLERGIMESLPSSFSTTEMVSLILSMMLYISKSIRQLQVCSPGSRIIFLRYKKVFQMHMFKLGSHNSNACSYM